MALAKAVVLAYARRGLDPAGALREASIAPGSVEDPQARITARQMELLSGHAMRELDDEALGWFSRRLPWGSYGMLCRASLTAPTLGVALKRWCRHHRLLTTDVELAIGGEGPVAWLEVAEHRRLGALRELCLVTLLRYAHGFACWAVDSRIPPLGIALPFPAPRHAPAYADVFPGPVTFGAPRTRLSFDAGYLDLPLLRDEQDMRVMLRRALAFTVFHYRRDRLLVPRVRDLLRRQAGEVRTARDAARRLHVSVRTMHRQLREEGSTLQALKDEARRDLAVELLGRGDRSVKQVAAAVGFRNEKSFSRAFRGWTGQPPATARRGSRERARFSVEP
jgi:AraC-like DNA-binding protein